MKNLKYFPFERNQYFYGKLLSVDDFQTEQKYMNDKRRMINRFLHGCGVVCGLNVVQVDDCTLSLETGLALDFAGREIVVDTPVTKKLSMIEGFDAYTEEDEDNSYLYLCIEYAEYDKDPVYNVAGSASGTSEFNKVAEGYHIYLTNREPEGVSVSDRSYMDDQKVIYWGNGIRITQIFPRYAESGKEFPFTVVVENMGQRLPIRFPIRWNWNALKTAVPVRWKFPLTKIILKNPGVMRSHISCMQQMSETVRERPAWKREVSALKSAAVPWKQIQRAQARYRLSGMIWKGFFPVTITERPWKKS